MELSIKIFTNYLCDLSRSEMWYQVIRIKIGNKNLDSEVIASRTLSSGSVREIVMDWSWLRQFSLSSHMKISDFDCISLKAPQCIEAENFLMKILYKKLAGDNLAGYKINALNGFWIHERISYVFFIDFHGNFLFKLLQRVKILKSYQKDCWSN